MGREFKFRWWNGVRMVPHASLMVGAKNLKSPEHMQFIGIKDEKGVEIYEGDIVLMAGWSDRGDGHYDDELAVIEFRETSFGRRTMGDDWDWIVDGDAEQFKVIGNVFENPDIFEPMRKDTKERLDGE